MLEQIKNSNAIKIDSMNNEEYHSIKAIDDYRVVSSSDLQTIDINPSLFYNSHVLKLDQDNDCFIAGTLIHDLVLEPQKAIDKYKVYEKVDLRTKEGKEYKKSVEEQASLEKKILIDYQTWASCENIAHNVKHLYGDIIFTSDIEKSYFIKNDIENLAFYQKARPDILLEYVKSRYILIDLKTTSAKNEYEFRKSVYEYKYANQLAYYIDVLHKYFAYNEMDGEIVNAYWIVASTTNPKFITVFKCDEDILISAKANIDNILHKYSQFLKGQTLWYENLFLDSSYI